MCVVWAVEAPSTFGFPLQEASSDEDGAEGDRFAVSDRESSSEDGMSLASAVESDAERSSEQSEPEIVVDPAEKKTPLPAGALTVWNNG